MRRLFKAVVVGLMAVAIAGTQFTAFSAEGNAPAAKEKASSRKGRGPFHGKVVATDLAASTVKIGKRTFKIVPETKVTNGSLAEAKVGDMVGGAYRTDEAGNLEVVTIWFGAKPQKETQKN